MKLRALMVSFVIVAFIAALPSASADAASIQILAGPDQGEVRVLTPWGEYVAYDEGGGRYWVGTQRQYDRQRAIGISKEDNFRLSTVAVADADATFVQDGTLRTHVGGIAIDGLSPTIDFGDKIVDERNRVIDTMRDVDISWIQARGEIPSLSIYSPHDQTDYEGQPTQVVGNGWYIKTFTVDRKDLTRPIALIFTARNARPTVIGLRSIAYVDYKTAELSAESDGRMGVSETTDEIKHLKFLRALDPSLSRQDPP